MIGWLDCSAGASGDMLLGALVDAGVPLAAVQDALAGLPVEELTLHAERTTRHGLAAVKVTVASPAGQPMHRTWQDIRAMLTGAALAEPVRDGALAAFGALAQAEGVVHGIDPEQVHFHEVGALDAIADVVGCCAGMQWLREHRGLRDVYASQVEVGQGATRSAHGVIPVPAPAVLAVLGQADAPVRGRLPYEACTPTGAALVAAFARGYGPLPPMRVRTVGAGAGSRDPDEAANILRLVLGEPAPAEAPPPPAVLLECNVDDQDPRLWPGIVAELLAAGAADAWLTPILMKKGRPAHTLHVLTAPERLAAVRAAVFAHTTTIGLRELAVTKHALDRETATVDVDGVAVRIKIARDGGAVVNFSVEYADVLELAERLAVPAKTALARATAAAHQAVYPDRGPVNG